jgi:hypothetical protein
MERLATVAKNAREKALAADDIIAEVAEISPEFATKLAHYSLPAWLLIVLLIWMVKSVQLSFEVDINKLIDQAHHLWKGEDPNFHEGGTPIPDPDFEAAKPDAEHQPFIPDYTLTAATPAAKLNRLARRREGRPPRRTRR